MTQKLEKLLYGEETRTDKDLFTLFTLLNLKANTTEENESIAYEWLYESSDHSTYVAKRITNDTCAFRYMIHIKHSRLAYAYSANQCYWKIEKILETL